jgi:prolipoprotein diacylglyceryltransferase
LRARAAALAAGDGFCGALRADGLAAGRVGNFINGELWGRFSDPALPWGMVFPGSGSMQPRHPSQVYQFLLEGLLLFVLLWLYARKPRKTGQVSGAFLLGYGVFRFIAEFFREPDEFLGILALGMSMGQWLCVPMIIGGAWLWVWATKRADPAGRCSKRLVVVAGRAGWWARSHDEQALPLRSATGFSLSFSGTSHLIAPALFFIITRNYLKLLPD